MVNDTDNTTHDIDAMKKMLAEKFQGLDDPKVLRDTSVKHRPR